MDAQSRAREAQLLFAVRNGNDAAFDELVMLYSSKLVRAAYALLGNRQDAEEVVQDAFVRAYRALPSFRGDSSFETWLHRITMNLSRNRFHWNQRRGSGVNVSISTCLPDEENNHTDWDLPDQRQTPEEELETEELQADLEDLIGALPESFRVSLGLRRDFGMSYDEIARLTNVPVNTVKTRIKRARELVREGLAQRK